MSKVKNSSRNITPFGGLNFVFSALDKLDISPIITEKIGIRKPNAQYSYTEIVHTFLANCLAQGSVLSDIETLNSKMQGQEIKKLPSADTIEYVCQELKTNNIILKNGDITHEFNFNNKLNETLLAIALKTNLLKANTDGYIVDFDNIVIPTEKQDAKKSYKKVKGYHPNFAVIGRIPVHVENHNGNTPAKFEQATTLRRMFENFRKENIKITYFRADSASFQASVINLLETEVGSFFIRNINSAAFESICNDVLEWKTIRIGYTKKEVASVTYQPKDCVNAHRVVVTRSPVKDGQTNLFTGNYTYYGIMTNHQEMTDKEVIEFYNQRGDAENTNKFLLNDFNLNHLPFPDMNTNTVYMHFQCIVAILFEWLKKILVANKIPNINLTMRIKAVCFHYITVATEFIRNKKENVLIVYSHQKYQHLKI